MRTCSNFQNLTVRGRVIQFDDNGLIRLNEIWSAAGFSKHRRPSDWTRLETTKRLITAVLERITGKSRNWAKTDFRSVLYTKSGSDGGTFADIRLAVAYAEFLDQKLALEVREVFLRYKAADATLADDILERASPEDNERTGIRALGRATRNTYTATLKVHGVTDPRDYANCTNDTYRALFKGTARELRVARGLPTKANVRDSMTTSELTYVMATESLATERIDDLACEGTAECRTATRTSADFIREAIERDRADRRRLKKK